MSSFLENILQATQYTSTSVKIEFLPRKVGLGYNHIKDTVSKNILKPVLKRMRNKVPKEESESSSEDIDRLSFILKKKK